MAIYKSATTTIHDPLPKDNLVLREDFKKLEGTKTPVALITLPENIDIKIENGELNIYNDGNFESAKESHCIFDTSLITTIKLLDKNGIDVKLISAKYALLPSLFLQDFSSTSFHNIQVDESPYELSHIVNENCFYAKHLISDISHQVIKMSEHIGANDYDLPYYNVSDGKLYTETQHTAQSIVGLVKLRINRFYLCIQPNKIYPAYDVFDKCFDTSKTVRRAAISYNAQIRNASR